MGKRDELNDYISGLDLDYGIRSLRATAFSMFEHFMLRIITKSGYRVTLKTAAEIASGLTQSYIGKIAEQISPLNVGETVRMMTIATEYGERLNRKYKNLRDDTSLDNLVSGYSSHGFVIDLEEAEDIFERVSAAPPPLELLMDTLGWEHAFPLEEAGHDPLVAYLRGRPGEPDNEVEAGIEDAVPSSGHRCDEAAETTDKAESGSTIGRTDPESDAQ